MSTDDEEICQIARAEGAEVPFMRPKNLANDYTTTMPVIAHAIDALSVSENDAVCCLYATAPFATPEDIRRGEKILINTGCDYAFTVTSYAFPIQRAMRITSEKKTEMFYPENFGTRSQDLEEAFHDAGQFYWGKTNAWVSGKKILHAAAPIFLPRHRVQDIVTQEDWERAERMFAAH